MNIQGLDFRPVLMAQIPLQNFAEKNRITATAAASGGRIFGLKEDGSVWVINRQGKNYVLGQEVKNDF